MQNFAQATCTHTHSCNIWFSDAVASLSTNNVYVSLHPFHKKQEALNEVKVTQAKK